MQVFLVVRRTDIPDGVLQQVDLSPNTSSRNYIYTPPGQTGYLQNIPSPEIAADVAAGPPVVASAELTGLAAYLIGNIDTTGAAGGAVFTGAQADTAAASIVAAARAGTALALADINALLAAVVAGTELNADGSTGTVAEVLSILAGRRYVIPAGTEISDGAGDFAGRVGSFDDTTFRQLFDTDGFLASNLNGNLSLMKSADFTYDGTDAAAVAVYAADGSLL